MHYFFGQIDEVENTIWLENEEAHHCANVLRLKIGDSIGVLHPDGKIIQAELTSIHKKQCVAKITSITQMLAPYPRIHLIVSPPKNNERLEWLVEKSVELHITSLYFILSERCLRKSVNTERLHHICRAAAKQSGNPFLPSITCFQKIQDISSHISSSVCLLMHCVSSTQKQPLNLEFLMQLHKNKITDIYACVGPEGDWTEKEIDQIKTWSEHTIEIDLGVLRLRTETAAIYVASVLKILRE